MQSLLRWSIENSTPNASAPTQPRQPLDPAIIDYILGPSPAEQMEDALAVATDVTVEEGEDEDEEESTGPRGTRMQALANLEMLVQDIDNAKHLTNKNMKMWKQLQDLLTSPKSSPNITKQTLWVIGTAVQNSPEAQDAYIGLKPIPTILSFLGANHNSKTRSKAVYALSGLLKHNRAAVDGLGAADGWKVLKFALEDTDSPIAIRRKISFLINTLLPPSPSSPQSANSTKVVHPNSHASMVSDPSSANTSPATLKAMREHGIIDSVVGALVDTADNQVQENCVNILRTFTVTCDAPLSPPEKTKLRKFLNEQSEEAGSDVALAERWDLKIDELKELKTKVAEN